MKAVYRYLLAAVVFLLGLLNSAICIVGPSIVKYFKVPILTEINVDGVLVCTGACEGLFILFGVSVGFVAVVITFGLALDF